MVDKIKSAYCDFIISVVAPAKGFFYGLLWMFARRKDPYVTNRRR